MRGIDVSHYQGDIDWEAVVAGGKQFAYIKATDGARDVDPRFTVNWEHAKTAGLAFGPYHYWHAAVPAQEQFSSIQHALQGVGYLPHSDLPVALDLEDPSVNSSSSTRQNVGTLLEMLGKWSGYRPVIYGSPSWLETWLGDGYGGHPLWIAEYGVQAPRLPVGWSRYAFWQYSSSETASGISGLVDGDVLHEALRLADLRVAV